ncbi:MULTISPECIES: hypothetical protein [Mesorhizobium]|uniref:Uncharacterized protein n=1 Tax=Mesorhizobium muleiense TaxID=1004279 RepID=A0A1G9AAZ6_9HYPH|nr:MULTISPECIES: hypothetical protein [Mesorhizobium]MCF6101767.1 hypothetical protein [Mesorhizobium muleiense]RWP10963.1 MAG: hypothetical protein EOR00_29670 [Mesorhizobium sp.]SDK24451.1 hypothetical protein SAMN05428953_11324 [Mesorhizobium muleiense]
MSKSDVFIPFDRELYSDIVYLSDGKIDPSGLAEGLVRDWIENTIRDGRWPEEHLEAVAEKYAPEVYAQWMEEDFRTYTRREEAAPLVWKEVTLRPGAEVRMAYGGKHHYAKVEKGRIVDADGSYSPSEWASKVAEGTSRNAWRDLWFREPPSFTWVPAQLLRQQAVEELSRRSNPNPAGGNDEQAST